MARDIIVIGASAGGLGTLRTLISGLPSNFAASIFVVLHTSPESPGYLGEILGRDGVLPTKTVIFPESIQPGTIYVVQPNHHLLIETGTVYASSGPKENRFRPAVDPLFRSAALAYGERVIGVILSGALWDGTAGMQAIKRLGGTTVVQDPMDDQCKSRRESALQGMEVDHCVAATELPNLLVRLAEESPASVDALSGCDDLKVELDIAKGNEPLKVGIQQLGKPSMFTCPECHGILLQLERENLITFRCPTGHAYSVESLRADLEESVERSLWAAVRVVQEYEMFVADLANSYSRLNEMASVVRLRQNGTTAVRQAKLLRSALLLSGARDGASGHR